MSIFHDDVDVLEDLARRYAKQAFGGLNQIISWAATMLAAQGIGESKRLIDLLCADEKASAISFPFFGSGHEFGSGHLGPNLELEAHFWS